MVIQYWVMIAGYVVMSIGGAWLFYVAFKESWKKGLLVMLVPFYVVYYVVTHWEKSRDPVMVHLLGWLIFFVGM